MNRHSLGLGALTGVLLTAPIMGLMYLADKLIDLSFPPFDVFDWIAQILPGAVVTFGIDTMVDALLMMGMSVAGSAKTAEQTIALSIFLFGGVVATMIAFVVVQRRPDWTPSRVGLIFGAVFGIPIALTAAAIGQSSVDHTFSFIWTVILFLGWGLVAVAFGRRLLVPYSDVTALDVAPEEERSVEVIGRRQFLIRMGAATATITVAGAGLGRILSVNEGRAREAELASIEPEVPGSGPMIDLPNEDDPVKPVLGTRPEYTAVRDHYKIFIRSQPTVIDGDAWELPISGLVENPVSLNLTDIMNRYEPRSEFVTLTCISNRVGGDLISTTYWTGASLQEILADVRPTSEARYLFIKSGDGFFETVDLDLIAQDERIMLAYAWDGRPIPFDHGFPLRIWLPDRYGMKQPKWITEIDVIRDYRAGYWVERNWDQVARIHATSVIDTISVDSVITNDDGQKLIPVGGIAFAGARGISKVEIRVDEDGPWQEAQLRSPLSETTWVIWRYEWPFQEGRHTFEVRCVEADGTPQIVEEASPRPSGATGIHSKNERI